MNQPGLCVITSPFRHDINHDRIARMAGISCPQTPITHIKDSRRFQSSLIRMDDLIHVTPSNPAPPYTPNETKPTNVSEIAPKSQDRSKLFIATLPLDELQEGPAPVDCPACGFRGLTKREYRVGNDTMFLPFYSSLNPLEAV